MYFFSWPSLFEPWILTHCHISESDLTSLFRTICDFRYSDELPHAACFTYWHFLAFRCLQQQYSIWHVETLYRSMDTFTTSKFKAPKGWGTYIIHHSVDKLKYSTWSVCIGSCLDVLLLQLVKETRLSDYEINLFQWEASNLLDTLGKSQQKIQPLKK